MCYSNSQTTQHTQQKKWNQKLVSHKVQQTFSLTDREKVKKEETLLLVSGMKEKLLLYSQKLKKTYKAILWVTV